MQNRGNPAPKDKVKYIFHCGFYLPTHLHVWMRAQPKGDPELLIEALELLKKTEENNKENDILAQ